MLLSHYKEVLGYLVRVIGCREKAQNVVQEAYLRLLSKKKTEHEYNNSSDNIRALFFKSAKNILIDSHRKKQHQSASDIDLESFVANRVDEPESNLAAKQELAIVFQRIDSLPPRCKQAFVLYRLKNLSYQQIAEEMGISVSMVEKHLINAMAACRKGLCKFD